MIPGRRVLVTGACGLLGGPLAQALAQDGWRVAIAHRDARSAEAASRLLATLGDRALALEGDLAEVGVARGFVDELEQAWGGIDALVNAAGSYQRAPLLEQSEADWRRAFDDNLHACLNICRAAATGMARRGFGRIVTFGLVNAARLEAQPNITAHAIAKAGVLALTRTLARLLAAAGVTVNCLTLGFIGEGSAAACNIAAERLPAGREGRPADVIEVVRFLLGEGAGYINGAEIAVSGGWG